MEIKFKIENEVFYRNGVLVNETFLLQKLFQRNGAEFFIPDGSPIKIEREDLAPLADALIDYIRGSEGSDILKDNKDKKNA